MDVDIQGLRFARGERVVLDIPSLRLRGNRTTAVLGPNGAGKTTLLRLLAALETPDEGRILRGGVPVGRHARGRQPVAYMFQEHVFLRQSVRHNLELGLSLRRIPRRERSERVQEAARLLGIEHLLDRRADRLSGGEARRASLARALCLRAPLVLLDEPLAGLDPPTYSRLLDELPSLLELFEATTVLVTHDRDEALRLGEDLVVLVDGCVHAAGSRHDVVLHPPGAAVAGMLGYVVLRHEGREVGVPADGLKPGPGPVEFWMVVEHMVDLVARQEIVGCIGGVRVHVSSSAAVMMPPRGERMLVHAARAVDLSRPG